MSLPLGQFNHQRHLLPKDERLLIAPVLKLRPFSRLLDVEGIQQFSQDEPHFGPSKSVPNAHVPTDKKWLEDVQLVTWIGRLLRDKAFWNELIRIREVP